MKLMYKALIASVKGITQWCMSGGGWLSGHLRRRSFSFRSNGSHDLLHWTALQACNSSGVGYLCGMQRSPVHGIHCV